ncbi:hypothetical protein ACKWTF_009381 [Chironomus riparius]
MRMLMCIRRRSQKWKYLKPQSVLIPINIVPFYLNFHYSSHLVEQQAKVFAYKYGIIRKYGGYALGLNTFGFLFWNLEKSFQRILSFIFFKRIEIFASIFSRFASF